MKRWRVAVLGIATVALLTSCSDVNTETDQVAMHFEGGSYTSAKFKECIKPSSGYVMDGPGDKHPVYPAGQRTWDVGTGAGEDAPKFDVLDKNGVTVGVSGTSTFALNTSCKDDEIPESGPTVEKNGVLPVFHVRIGRKFGVDLDDAGKDASQDQGYVEFLRAYMHTSWVRAAEIITKKYDAEQLNDKADLRATWQADVAEEIQRQAELRSGLEIFCQKDYIGEGDCGKMTLSLNAPDLPDNIRTARSSRRAAQSQQSAAEAQRLAMDAQALATASKVRQLGPNGYLIDRWLDEYTKAKAQCRQNGNGDWQCPPMPQAPVLPGTGLTITGSTK